jgi:hypothetical protein
MSATLTVPRDTPKTEVGSSTQPLEERIRARAYELYEQRAGAPGDPDADWYRAESEIIGDSDQTDH